MTLTNPNGLQTISFASLLLVGQKTSKLATDQREGENGRTGEIREICELYENKLWRFCHG